MNLVLQFKLRRLRLLICPRHGPKASDFSHACMLCRNLKCKDHDAGIDTKMQNVPVTKLKPPCDIMGKALLEPYFKGSSCCLCVYIQNNGRWQCNLHARGISGRLLAQFFLWPCTREPLSQQHACIHSCVGNLRMTFWEHRFPGALVVSGCHRAQALQ